MKKFNFRLETIHRLRTQNEKKKLKDLGIAVMNLNQAIEEKRNVVAEIKDITNNLTLYFQENNFNIDKVKSYHNYIHYLREESELIEKKITKLKTKRDIEKQLYIQASRERKIVDKLKEKALNIYLDEINKEEQNFADEVSNQKSARKIINNNLKVKK